MEKKLLTCRTGKVKASLHSLNSSEERMGWFDGKSREEEQIEEANKAGQEAGSQGAGFLETFVSSVSWTVMEGEAAGKAYDAGVENGQANPAKGKD
jgi:hypothetical protein